MAREQLTSAQTKLTFPFLSLFPERIYKDYTFVLLNPVKRSFIFLNPVNSREVDIFKVPLISFFVRF